MFFTMRIACQIRVARFQKLYYPRYNSLALGIRSDNNIEGILLNGKEVMICHKEELPLASSEHKICQTLIKRLTYSPAARS